MLNTQELRQLPNKDLHEELERASRNYLKIRMNVEEKAHNTNKLRRYIARIKTIQEEMKREDTQKASKEPAKAEKVT